MFKNNKSIKAKVLKIILIISLLIIITLGAVSIYAMINMQQSALQGSDRLGDTAAQDTKQALQDQAKNEMASIAKNTAALVDEKLQLIQNQSKMVADMATNILSNPEDYSSRSIDYLQEDQVGTTIPHFRTASGVELENIKDELYKMANVQDMLKQYLVIGSGVTASYVGVDSGYFITVDTQAAGPNRKDYDATTRSWYVGAKENDGVFWTPIIADASGRGAGISCGMPFYEIKNGKKIFRGAAGTGALLTDVSSIITSVKTTGSGYAFLLNENGQMVMTSKQTELTTDEKGNIIGEDYLNSDNAELNALGQDMVASNSGLMELTIDGESVYVAYYPMSSVNWSIGVVIPVSDVIAPALDMEHTILSQKDDTIVTLNNSVQTTYIILAVIILVTIAFAVYFSFRFSKSLTQPILALEYGVHRIATGDLDYTIKVKTQDELELLGNAVNKMAFDLKEYIRNLSKVTAEKERIGAELNVATQIQSSMLPSIFPAFPERKEFDIFASMLPAKEVGGDFYDFFLVDDDHLAIVMADVSGKGVPAALFMVIAKTLIKNNAQYGKAPKEVFETVNNLLCEGNEAGMFVTGFMGYYEISTGKFTYVNAGHNPPVLCRNGEDCQWLPTKAGFVLAGMEGMRYKQDEIQLNPGDMLYLYTDGVTEAVNRADELFTDPRLLRVFNENKNKDLKGLLRGIKASIDIFADGADQADDITMLALRVAGGDNQ